MTTFYRRWPTFAEVPKLPAASRKSKRPRCDSCGLHPELCPCATFPTVTPSFRLVVVQHVAERFKPNNTARTLLRMVPSATLLTYATRDGPFDPGPLLDADVDYFVLLPREDAIVIEADPDTVGRLRTPSPRAGHSVGFVVLDGTWHQCSRMSRRVPTVRDLPCVALPSGRTSVWPGRRQHDPRGLSTFEAGARLIEVIDGPQAAAPMFSAFEGVIERLLYMQGKRKSYAGMPAPDDPPP